MKKMIVMIIISVITVVPLLSHAGQMTISNDVADLERIEDTTYEVAEITYADMISNISNKTGKSIEEVKSLIPDKADQMNRIAKLNGSARSRLYKYFTVSTQLAVSSTYKPTFYAYCYGWQDNDVSVMPRGLIEIEYADLNRQYNGGSKQFSGRIYGKLEDNWKLYYDVNGDFYGDRPTTVSIGGSAGIDEIAEANFSVSYSSDHYSYYQKSGRINFY